MQPGTSLFSCLILPLLLGNFCWHAHSHTKQGILVTESGPEHSADSVKVLRLKTTNNTVSGGRFYSDCTKGTGEKNQNQKNPKKPNSGLMLGPVL